ncbi:MAG: GHKL domain-containing protein [Bacteroidia bacterium]|nr:GHKL domain-containing protein [Bacteroidia bacterium]
MNPYRQKQIIKALLLAAAIIIGALSLWYTNTLVQKLSEEEKKKVELWAEATRKLADLTDPTTDFNFLINVIRNNTTVPVIMVDEKENILSWRNLDSLKMEGAKFAKAQLEMMRTQHEPIEIKLYDGKKNQIYYKDSLLLTQLRYYPFFQLGVIALFILVSYLAFSSSRRAEQNQVWVGMAKETAHQLGTPLSSLLAWLDLLRLKNVSPEYINEIEKDIGRLNTITERFSKIGSPPALKKENLAEIVRRSMSYIQTRSSGKVTYEINVDDEAQTEASVNSPLLEWVFENVLKNAIDAMNGVGKISVNVTDQLQFVYIDISDTGKGVPRGAFSTVFKPGFTTKSRGWGLGLSLSKRIIEEYHHGEIFIKASEPGVKTTFRIVLRK